MTNSGANKILGGKVWWLECRAVPISAEIFLVLPIFLFVWSREWMPKLYKMKAGLQPHGGESGYLV